MFEEIGKVYCVGNSLIKQYYYFFDENLLVGISYY